MDISKHKGFTIVEMLVVLFIIGLLSVVIVAGISSIRSKGRDTQVLSDKQLIILALVRAKEATALATGYAYPGTAGVWQCLKSSGTCWKSPNYSGNGSLISAIQAYFPGGVIPQPPDTKSGEYRHDAYLYSPSVYVPALNETGPFLVWWQEKPITNCNGHNAGALDAGIYYCYERLPK